MGKGRETGRAEGVTGATAVGPFRLIGKVCLLGLLVVGTIAAILLAIPDSNDYALASRLKHERLASLPSPKIVLVGGSNLAYGVDSASLGRQLDCPVVNMGMNGYLGVRYMLEEVKPRLAAGDAVVVALEWDSFYKEPEGDRSALLAVIKANPQTVRHLTWEQMVDVVRGAPGVAQQKGQRVAKELMKAVGLRSARPTAFEEKMTWLDAIESLRGFNAEGDLTSHLSAAAPMRWEIGLEAFAPGAKIHESAVDLVVGFAEEMKARGVKTIVSYTPVPRSFFHRHAADMSAIHARFAASPHVAAPRAPTEFIFDDDQFFDTIYHLNEKGRPIRTQKLVDDLAAQAACPARAQQGEPRDEPRPST